MDGFLNINKPLGKTSSDIVVRIRHMLPKGTRVGHGGTLDPEAAGVLPVCVGKAARLFDYIIDKEKVYEARMRLGVTTSTQDATGEIIDTKPVNVSEDDVRNALPHFIGDIEQIPPMYSAVKKDGERLYKLARKGEIIEMPARKCRVDNIEILRRISNDEYDLRITCGKGVYIRTICHDIGAYLGCGAHMAALTRTEAGAFKISDAVTLDMLNPENIASYLVPIDFPIGKIPRVDLDERAAHAVKNGNPIRKNMISAPVPDCPVRVYMCGVFAGIAQKDEQGLLRFKAMLMRDENE